MSETDRPVSDKTEKEDPKGGVVPVNTVGVSSSAFIDRPEDTAAVAAPRIVSVDPESDVSPVFTELATPKLPVLPDQNRIRLLMQTPTRLFLYWTVNGDPYQKFASAFAGGYPTLVVRLIDEDTGRIEQHQIGAEGSWWFDVESDTLYRAEIGLVAENRPFVRVMFSNEVETPRRSPSPRSAATAQWAVSSNRFAKVLEAAGFSQDAFDVALAGDDTAAAEERTFLALGEAVSDVDIEQIRSVGGEDVRFALFALASGMSLEELRHRISPALYEFLRANIDRLSRENALAALEKHFDLTGADDIEESEITAVFGASLINFPRRFRRRSGLPKLMPVSSLQPAGN